MKHQYVCSPALCLPICYAFALANAVGMPCPLEGGERFSFRQLASPDADCSHVSASVSAILETAIVINAEIVIEIAHHNFRPSMFSEMQQTRTGLLNVENYIDPDAFFDFNTDVSRHERLSWAGFKYESCQKPQHLGACLSMGQFFYARPDWKADTASCHPTWLNGAEGIPNLVFLYNILQKANVDTVSRA